MNPILFGFMTSKGELVVICLILKLPESMDPIIGSKSKDTWMQKVEQKSKDSINITPKKNFLSSTINGLGSSEKNFPCLQKNGKINLQKEKGNMWVEWKGGLLNLKYVKRIYIEELFHQVVDMKHQPTGKIVQRFRLRIILINQEGEYDQYYETKEEALADYETFKSYLF